MSSSSTRYLSVFGHKLDAAALAEHGHTAHSQMQTLWQNTKVLLSNPDAVPFFAMSLLMGFGVGVLYTYLFLYLDELGEPTYLPLFSALKWPIIRCKDGAGCDPC